jgi:hypothetical protein
MGVAPIWTEKYKRCIMDVGIHLFHHLLFKTGNTTDFRNCQPLCKCIKFAEKSKHSSYRYLNVGVKLHSILKYDFKMLYLRCSTPHLPDCALTADANLLPSSYSLYR